MTTEAPIIIKAVQPRMLDRRLFVLFPKIFLSLAILKMANRMGTAMTPLMTVVYICAFIGSMLEKFIQSRMSVEAAITFVGWIGRKTNNDNFTNIAQHDRCSL